MFTGLQLRKSEQNDFHAIVFISQQNPMMWPSLKSFLRDDFNEWSHHRVWLRYKKVSMLKTINFWPYLLPWFYCLYALVVALGVLCRVLQFLIDSTPLWPKTTVFGSLLFFCLGFSSLSTSGQALIFIETETDTRDPTVLPSLSQNRPICSFKCLVYSTNTPYTTKRAYLCTI